MSRKISSRNKTRRNFSVGTLKLDERCMSMRSRLKKGINENVVEAFQVKNIPLRNKF